MRIPSKILQGHAIERYSPDYPKIARQAGVHGEVSVEVIVSPTGSVESARAISGHPLLASCAVEAARRWRFQPTLLNGVAVRVTGVITFVFKLDE
jgi:TonB family protein